MANLKEIRNRITSVQSTQQITKAMKMVAAAKLRKAQEAIEQMRPYANKLNGILNNVSAAMENTSIENKYAVAKEEVNNVLIVVITSDRGLCGGFNSQIFKGVNALLTNKYAEQHAKGNVTLLTLGTKGRDFFGRRDHTMNENFVDTFKNLSFDYVKEAAEFTMDSFVEGKFDKVELVYNEFKNVALQIVRTEQFLPIQESEEEVDTSSNSTDYIFEPSKEFIAKELIPKSLKIQFYKAVLESNASEMGARMTAMDKATDNAGELIKSLRLEYNRSRQAAITTEILEIVAGAEALAQGK
ncbi:MAG: ATP synthase F1 subunit gamma [Cytophagales bacterium]|nr:ATP synthase F1 subunit gamma [Cytophagales bacterium]